MPPAGTRTSRESAHLGPQIDQDWSIGRFSTRREVSVVWPSLPKYYSMGMMRSLAQHGRQRLGGHWGDRPGDGLGDGLRDGRRGGEINGQGNGLSGRPRVQLPEGSASGPPDDDCSCLAEGQRGHEANGIWEGLGNGLWVHDPDLVRVRERGELSVGLSDGLPDGYRAAGVNPGFNPMY